ncbi:VENN motif pre-toxin domain-containing protein [Cronobacter dublinensis]|uniref:VENN motif pre-toxin domain-containing protein n=1 Tax=Cronobacter dublinensis TaxID=413497 RepID=UPI000CFDBFA6|nr:VENN motif pre-toxin domain-containing protein [Cronobacter dublinensis]
MASLPINRSISGASDAAVGEAMGYLIAKEAYKKDPSQMDEIEKQTVAALSTLASGLAGNSTEAVATAAKAGHTTVDNNALGSVLAAANKQKPGTTEN